MRKRIFVVVILVIIVTGIILFFFPAKTVSHISGKSIPSANTFSTSTIQFKLSSSSEIAFVPRIIDGDTIEVEIVDPTTRTLGKPQSLRYVGMDTPETVDPKKPVECFGHEASARNQQLVAGDYVILQKDVSDRDKYGRLLRFVFLLDGTFVDLELVREGYARVLTIPPDVEYASDFAAAAASAQSAKLGFWGACPSYPFVE
jgi:endonuclease YncB( thermonuclease family)